MTKKYLPFILLGVGLLVLVITFFVVKKFRQPKVETTDEESVLIDVALKDRPIVSLVPRSDGHYLKLKIDKIVIPATSLDYELLYQTKEITQGVPGTVTLVGKTFEVELLLGSESSGKFRYDEGVENGTVTLRFRNSDGKLIARFTTDFHMQSNTDTLTSSDDSFTYKLDKTSKDFFVTIGTIGMNDVESVSAGPFGVFASSNGLPMGSADSSWKKAGDTFYKE